jgi:hypothetical protein
VLCPCARRGGVRPGTTTVPYLPIPITPVGNLLFCRSLLYHPNIIIIRSKQLSIESLDSEVYDNSHHRNVMKNVVFHALEPFCTSPLILSESQYRPSFRDGRPEETKRRVLGFIKYLEHGNTRMNVILTSDGKRFPRPRERCSVTVSCRAPSKPVNHR